MSSIFDFLSEQPDSVIDRLYECGEQCSQSPWACKAIFQSLSPLAKLHVTRLLFVQKAVSVSEIQLCLRSQSFVESSKATDELIRLRILIEDTPSDNALMDNEYAARYRLNRHFQRSLQTILSNRKSHNCIKLVASERRFDLKYDCSNRALGDVSI